MWAELNVKNCIINFMTGVEKMSSQRRVGRRLRKQHVYQGKVRYNGQPHWFTHLGTRALPSRDRSLRLDNFESSLIVQVSVGRLA